MRWKTAATLVLLLGSWSCSQEPGLPDPYRHIPVPEARLASEEARQRGRELFLKYCAICHGVKADGKGPRQNLSRRPANFTDPIWRRRSTPRKVFYVVREGVQASPMPAWKVLDEDQTWDLVAYVLSVANDPR